MIESLSQNEIDTLKKLQEDLDIPALKQKIHTLRGRKHTLREIAEVLGVSTSTVQWWQKNVEPRPVSTVIISDRAVESFGEEVHWNSQVSTEDIEKFATLSKSARKVRASTPKAARTRRDAEELDELICRYVRRMVPVADIARYMGVTHRAVRARIERYEGQGNSCVV